MVDIGYDITTPNRALFAREPRRSDHALFAQRRDLVPVESEELAVDLLVVLAEPWGTGPHRPRSLGEVRVETLHEDRPQHGILDPDEVSARPYLWIRADVRDVVTASERHLRLEAESLDL